MLQKVGGGDDMKKFYHATPYTNLGSILVNGLRTGYDGVVYLAETQEAALKFICIRCFNPILVIEVELDESCVSESFDHSYSFFQEKAFTYPNCIPADQLGDMWRYG